MTRNDLLDYALEIEDFDAHIQKIVQTLKENGAYENTLIIVTSDHGMPFPRVKAINMKMPIMCLWPQFGLRK
ncbi:sulfatase-like hydrolase/transferase [Winogradskyella maritima]|nr:sulfatase-like hydrolase/transferase [Winogradskyella maritima]